MKYFMGAADRAASLGVNLFTLTFLTFFAPGLRSQTLVGYFDFEQSSSPVSDQAASPVNFSAAGSGSPVYNESAIPGQSFGATATLDGASYWSGSASKYSNLRNDFSVMAWVNPANISGVGGRSTLIFGVQTPGGGWGFGFNGSEQGVGREGQPFFVNFGINSFDLGSDPTRLPQNTWVNLAITKSSTTGVTFYINGNLIGSASSTTFPTVFGDANPPGSDNWNIGNGADMNRFFAGGIDELRIYDGVLSLQQIQTISAVPEPSTYGVVFGLAALAFAVRRRLRAV